MTKKFDVVIGNPPYQEEAQWRGHPRHADLPPVHGRRIRGRHQGRAHHAGTLPVQRGLHAQGVEREDAGGRAPEGGLSTSPTQTVCSRALRTPSRAASPSPTATRSASSAPSDSSPSTPSSTRSCTRSASRGRPSSRLWASRARARTATRTRCTRTTLRRSHDVRWQRRTGQHERL